MAIVTVDKNNIGTEHICCAITDKKGENCVGSKKAWLTERFEDGLVFKKLDERGKVFIEYIPVEFAFAPITAPNYMFINCFWVSGKFKGHGHGKALLQECINDAKSKGMDGLVVLSSSNKKPFLSDPKFLKYNGFTVADTALPYYELLYLRFNEKAVVPRFNDIAKHGRTEKTGLVLYYTNGCPHTDKYVKIIQKVARDNKTHLTVHKITTVKEAKKCPAPFTIYTIFKDGEFVTNEILTEKKFIQLL